MTAPAFTVQGYGVTIEQRDAGLAVMRGVFSTEDVQIAFHFAGIHSRYICGLSAFRLLQAERRAGRIRVAKGKGRGMWEVARG